MMTMKEIYERFDKIGCGKCAKVCTFDAIQAKGQ